jgi:3-hydroxyisobutyrate dehydrogenase-like beta-hydroxyacid dehydrogenase
MDVGFVGLGRMGGAIARRLLKARGLTVFDLRQEAVAALAGEGATPVASAAELALRSDVVMLCLPTSDDVGRVLFQSGAADALKPGGLIVDMTTGDPTATREMAARLAASGRHMIDAPVSGGPMGAEAGTLAIMVGAPDELFAQIRPVLQEISPNVMHAGRVGAGHTMKLVNNLVSAGNRLVAFEALTLAAKNGLDPATCVAIMQKSSGRSFTTEVIFPRFILTGTLKQDFTIGLMHKDVTLAIKLGAATGTPLAIGEMVRSVLDEAVAAGEADEDLCTLIRRYEAAAGTKVSGEG